MKPEVNDNKRQISGFSQPLWVFNLWPLKDENIGSFKHGFPSCLAIWLEPN